MRKPDGGCSRPGIDGESQRVRSSVAQVKPNQQQNYGDEYVDRILFCRSRVVDHGIREREEAYGQGHGDGTSDGPGQEEHQDKCRRARDEREKPQRVFTCSKRLSYEFLGRQKTLWSGLVVVELIE